MAELTGPAQTFNADSETVDSSRQIQLGTVAYDRSGNEYIYLQGNTNVSADDVVTYDESHQASQITANAVGPVASAPGSAVDANSFGWFMIRGQDTVNSDSGVADNSEMFIDGTDGRVDDTAVAGDLVVGMFSRGTDSSNKLTVQMQYPVVTDNVGS